MVQVEAYLSGRKKFFSTRIYLKPEQWDARKQEVIKHPNADALNRMIHEFMASIERHELDLWRHGRRVSLELLKESMSKDVNNEQFLPFLEKEIGMASVKSRTRQNHLSTLRLLREFRKDILFTELTFELVCSFESFLQSKGYHVNTIAKHLKHLKRYINVAINKECISMDGYAFRKYRIKTMESHHTHLGPEELAKMERLQLTGRCSKYQHVLDAFLFCCYAGMRYSDFVSLTPDNLVEVNAQKWLVYKSVKTGTEVRLPIYLLFGGKCIEILNKYRENLSVFFQLKDNSNVNKILHILSRMAGLGKNISFHTARHTNATLLIYDGVNITTVQKLLGHKNIKTTQIYATIMDMTVINDLEKNHS